MKTEERLAFLRKIIDRLYFLPLSPQARSFFVFPPRVYLSAGNDMEFKYVLLIGIRTNLCSTVCTNKPIWYLV